MNTATATSTENWPSIYNPVTGRFMSEDPIGLTGEDTNFYRYVLNNSSNAIDPNGSKFLPPDFGARPIVVTPKPPRDPRTASQIAHDSANDPNINQLSPIQDGAHDAVRHCTASCAVASVRGDLYAELLGDANEVKGDLRGQKPCSKKMDQVNNQIGRNLKVDQSESNDVVSDCAVRCLTAYKMNQLQTLK